LGVFSIKLTMWGQTFGTVITIRRVACLRVERARARAGIRHARVRPYVGVARVGGPPPSSQG
jgi:hypothetical protein